MRFRDGGRSDDDPFRVSEVRASDEKRSAVPFEVSAGGRRALRRVDLDEPDKKHEKKLESQTRSRSDDVWRSV